MGILRTGRSELVQLLAELRRIESDAATACRHASARIRDEPLTRGTLLSFQVEHETHRATLERRIAQMGGDRLSMSGPSGIVCDEEAFEDLSSATAVLRVLRKNAEVAVRRYQAALRVVPDELLSMVREQCNAWLRHRAWLSARVDAFVRTRDSRPSIV